MLTGGPIELKLVSRQTLVVGKSVELTRLEFDLLAHLLKHPDRAFKRDELLAAVWNYPGNVETRTRDNTSSRCAARSAPAPRSSRPSTASATASRPDTPSGVNENDGRRWRKSKSPEVVNIHDFPAPEVPRAYPYGIYDLGRNSGHVSVWTDHDASAFAAASIRGWLRAEGRRLYPKAKRVVIKADGGGSNGYRQHPWKLELQKLADGADRSFDLGRRRSRD